MIELSLEYRKTRLLRGVCTECFGFLSTGSVNVLAMTKRGGVIARSETTKRSQFIIMSKQYYVYIMTNKSDAVLYTGVTNNLKRRVYEHKEKLINGFTTKYNINKLVYYEVFEAISNAISREKQIKSGSRQKKINLINNINKAWKDLFEEL